jgi:cytochrome b subunit of formate dehydrogenase
MFDSARSNLTSRHVKSIWLLLAAILLGWPPQVLAQQAPAEDPNATCAGCHDSAAKVSKSAHAKVGCAQCHLKHEQYPHPAGVPKPACATCHIDQAGDHARSVHGQELKKGNAGAPSCDSCHGAGHEIPTAKTTEFHRAVPQTCGMCHSDVQEKFNTSVHGKAVTEGVRGAPVCTDCHGEHNILRPSNTASTVNVSHVRETCGSCHGDLRLTRQFGLPADRITSFDQSFHGLASKTGSQTVANCASCHGVHDILPSSDPKSMIHTENLATTCGNCHPGAGKRFALGPIHVPDDAPSHPIVASVRSFYLFLIPAVIGLMLLHHAGDFARKFRSLRLRGNYRAASPSAHGEFRMYGFERIQHALLAISFMVLVWSGFALKYPNQWWASPLGAGPEWAFYRGWIHRIAGVVMIVAGLVHVVSLIVSRPLRQHWLTLIPRHTDVKEAAQAVSYNLFLRSKKPVISPHSYIEKAEYWAVVWGSLIMALTGGLLWANNWSLRNLPHFIIDLATTLHFYEAVLATLAIFVWHFYSVIFDPEVYPMDLAWLTGKSPRRHGTHPEESHGNKPAEPPARVDSSSRLPVE